MENKNFAELTNEELLVEKEKLRKSKRFHAFAIGFLVGILIFGLGSWFMMEEKSFGFFIPMIFPVVFIYKSLKNRNQNRELEEVLKERDLA